jgi:hypothetical protein
MDGGGFGGSAGVAFVSLTALVPQDVNVDKETMRRSR